MPVPPKMVRLATRSGLTTRHLADLRSQLPLTEYLAMLHTLALTGQMPCYDPPAAANLPPQRNGQYSPPDRQLQFKTLTYLTDKAFAPIERPAATRAAEALADDPTRRIVETSAEARSLTVGELMRRLTAPAAPAPEPAPEQEPAPHADATAS